MGRVAVLGTGIMGGPMARNLFTFVDAPVLGTKKPAEEGQLFVLASGPPEARAECEPVFEAISRGHVWLGEAGLGTRPATKT